ncbi:contractile injection system tape measure protein [Rhodovulum kholense]|nr:contractile injection system tape measure protein [Rhodovulum kholense]
MVGRQRAARRLVPALGGESARLRPSPETLDRIAAQLRSAPPPETLAALASGGAAARAAAQALRQATIGRPGGADPILAGLAPDDIARLIAALLPKGAQALSEAVAALDRTARDPVSARRAVAQALLETRPVDLDAARALAPKDPGARALADLLALAGASPGRVTPAPALPGDGTPGAPGRDRAAQTGEAPDATRDAASPGQPAEDRSGASDNGAFAAPPAQTAPPERKADAPDAGPETLGSGPAAEGPPAATPKVGPQGLSDRAASKTGSADGGHAADRATPAAHAAQADPAGPRPGEPGEKPDAPVIGATTDPGPQPGEAAGDGTAPDAGILRAAARNLRDPKPTGSAEGSGRAAGNSPDKAALPGPRSADGGHTADRATPAAHAAQGDPAGPRPGEPGEKPDAPVTGATTDPGPQPGEADGDGTAPDAAPDAGILRAAARNLRDPKPTGSAEGSGRAAGNSPDKAALPGPRSADGGHTADRATPAAHAAQGDPAGPRPGEPGEQPDAPVTGATTGPDPQPGGSARAEPDKAAGDGTAPDTGILGAAARNRRDAKPTGSAEGSGRATGNGPDKGALPGPRSAEGGHAADRAIPAAHAAQADPTKQRPGEPGEKPDAPVTGATTDPAPQPGEAAGDGTTPDAGFLGAAARNRRDPKPTGSAKEAGRATGNSPDKAAPPGPQSDADVAARAGRSRGPEGNAPRQDAEGSPGADPATPSVGAARDGWSGHLLGHDARPLPETRGLAGRGDRPAPAGSAGHATAKERPSDAAQRRASGPPPERNGVPDPSRIEALAGRDLPEAPKGKPLDGPAGPSVPRTAETARPDPAADPGTGKTGQARADAENAARPGADGPADGPPDPARPSRAHTDAADAAPAATEAPGPADAPPETEAREAALAGLYEAALGDGASTVRGMLDQIAGALPVALTSPLDRDGLDAAKLAAALVAGPGPGAPGRAAEAFLQALSPDEAERVVLLRSLAARLGYAAPAPGPQGALRRTARAAVEDLLKAAAPAPAPARAAPPVGTASEAATHSLTERAGLVLFHPYLRMLFDRLGLIEARQIRADGLPRAAAVLAALAEAQPAQRLPDPLERLLLGMPEGARPEPCPTLAPAETALIDSLLRSVIGQWTRLGKTSPEGLRATFIRRRGLIGTDDRGAPRLTVAPGPFDMLLDGLPWALGPIRLPWMPEALSVIWRNADD